MPKKKAKLFKRVSFLLSGVGFTSIVCGEDEAKKLYTQFLSGQLPPVIKGQWPKTNSDQFADKLIDSKFVVGVEIYDFA